jgi:signal transduction histidine kinase
MIGHKNSRLYDLLEREPLSREPIRPGPGRLIAEQLERERSRIARELHAGAGQPLAGIKMNLETLDHWAVDLPPAGRDALARLQTLAEQALQQVRAVSHSLHPPDWQGLKIGNALRDLIQSSGLSSRMEVEIQIEPLPEEPPHAVKIALYRCTQESISNVMRHSGASRFSVSLAAVKTDPSRPLVELRIEDNGHGFTSEPAVTGKGIGLKAMREHAAELGGSCQISGGPEGVRICVRLPLTED